MNKPIKTVKPFFKVNFEDLQFAKGFFENQKHYIEWLFCISEYYQGNIIDPKTKIVLKYFNNYKKTMDFIIESKIKGLEGAILKAEKQQVNNETLEGVVEGGFKEPCQQIINNKELSNKDKGIIDYQALLEVLNTAFSRSFKLINKKVRSSYEARLKDGYSKDQIMDAINNCKINDYHKEKNYQYCTPEFFSRAETLDKYSNVTKQDKVVYAFHPVIFD
jgi:uncharacterized phage protein (TIGR02220 family)